MGPRVPPGAPQGINTEYIRELIHLLSQFVILCFRWALGGSNVAEILVRG